MVTLFILWVACGPWIGRRRSNPPNLWIPENFFWKGPDGEYFLGNRISVATTPLCHCIESSHRQYIKKWVWLCANKALFTKTESQNQLTGCSLSNDTLNSTMTFIHVQLFLLWASIGQRLRGRDRAGSGGHCTQTWSGLSLVYRGVLAGSSPALHSMPLPLSDELSSWTSIDEGTEQKTLCCLTRKWYSINVCWTNAHRTK